MYHQSNIYTADRQQKQLDQQQQHVKQLQREVAVKRILVSQVSLRRSFKHNVQYKLLNLPTLLKDIINLWILHFRQ